MSAKKSPNLKQTIGVIVLSSSSHQVTTFLSLSAVTEQRSPPIVAPPVASVVGSPRRFPRSANHIPAADLSEELQFDRDSNQGQTCTPSRKVPARLLSRTFFFILSQRCVYIVRPGFLVTLQDLSY